MPKERTLVNVIGDFWAKVQKGTRDACWMWKGALNSHGYGEYRFGDVNWRAHQIAYFLLNGYLPTGLENMEQVLRHVCDNGQCVNPLHLIAGTQLENMHDQHRYSYCHNAHPMMGDNLMPAGFYKGRERRRCRACYTAMLERNRAASLARGHKKRGRKPKSTEVTL